MEQLFFFFFKLKVKYIFKILVFERMFGGLTEKTKIPQNFDKAMMDLYGIDTKNSPCTENHQDINSGMC
jgi:hypothetical protein